MKVSVFMVLCFVVLHATDKLLSLYKIVTQTQTVP